MAEGGSPIDDSTYTNRQRPGAGGARPYGGPGRRGPSRVHDSRRPVDRLRGARAALLFVVAAAVLTADASAQTRLGTYEAPTGVSAHRETVAWSAFDPATGRFQLMLSQRGAVRAAAVGPRRVPFDADVGRGPKGRAVIVYSRCSEERYNRETAASRTRGCDLYVLDPAGGGEREVSVSGARSGNDTDPVVWGDRIVFNRSRGNRTRLHVAPLTGGRARPIAIRGRPDATITDKDLFRGRLAVALMRIARGGREETEVRMQRLEGRRPRLVMRKTIGEAQRQFIGLGFDRGRLAFAMVCHPTGCRSGTAYRAAAGELESAKVPVSLGDFALTRDRAYWVDSPGDAFRWNVEDAGVLRFR